MSSTAKVRLEGWLIKRKSKDRPTLFKNENLRWFRIQEVEGADQVELALCYYHSRKDKEAKGWIYLRDISQITDDKKSFTVSSAARTMTLEAQSHAEHVLWIQTLANCSPFVGGNKDTRNDAAQSKQDSPSAADAKDSKPDNKEESDSFATLSQEHLNSIPKPEEKASSTIGNRSISLFSRHAHGEKNSFYTQASNVGSSLHTISDDYGESENQLYRVESGISNIDEGADPEKPRSSSNPRSASHSKEDHRLQGFRAGDTSGTVSGRLNKYINKDGTGKLARPDSQGDIEDVALEEPNKLRTRDLRAQHRSRQEARLRRDSDSSHSESGIAMGNNLAVSEESESDEDDRNESKRQDEPSDHSEEEKRPDPPSNMPTTNPPAKTGMARPPPTSAPPRRAKDALAEAENQKTRKSIDELLFRKENRAESKTNDADSSDDENLDLKAEFRKYSNASETDAAVTTKPPRPNPKGNPPHAIPMPTAARSKSGGYRMGTPPRPSADPGSQVDQNFVTDDWDQDEDENYSRHNYSNKQKSNSGSSRSDKRQDAPAGVNADPNWLEENFDD